MTAAVETTLEQADGQRRRKPLFYVVCIGLICLGALVSAYAFTRISNSEQVIAVAVTVHAGQAISAGDLELVDVNSDTELQTVPASQEATVVGQVAQLDMAAGSVVTPDSVGKVSIPAKGQAVVGLSLTPAQLPASSLSVSDRVSLVAVGDDNRPTFAQNVATIAGTVVGVSTPNASGSGGGDPQNGNSVVDVSVPVSTAPGLAAKAATGKVALVLNSPER